MSANAVATRDGYEIAAPSGTLAIRPGQEMWTDKQRAALAVLGIKDATNADLAVFMHYCQKTGLDPFSRQIYMIMRREKQGDQWVAKQTIQVGIDGFRVIRDRIAARTGATIEYEDTIWYDDGGGEHAVWLSDAAPAACRVTVLKNGRRFPAVVRTASYMATKDGKPVSQWRTQADHMIEKCAEAFALRRAFPHDLGGVYLEDEMPPAQEVPRPQRVTAAEVISRGEPAATEPPAEDPQERAQPKPPRPASEAALKRMNDLIGQIGLGPPEDVAALIQWITGTTGEQVTVATVAHVRDVTTLLADALAAAGGDTDKAAAEIWAQYKRMNPQAGDEGA
jgi:phage recombination protein Bet